MSVTFIMILITVLLFLITESKNSLKSKMLFNAYQIKHHNQWHRWISHAFIHANISHLGVNMFVLYVFGLTVEDYLSIHTESGWQLYILMYIVAILISSARAFLKHQDNPGYNSLGASGATSAMLFACIAISPLKKFYLYIPAFIFGILYLWYEHSQGKRGGTGIAHDAHFWGAVLGFVWMLLLVPETGPNFLHQIGGYLDDFIGR